MADGEKCGVDPRICTNPRLARVACSPVGWPATGSANRLGPMQDLEWQIPDCRLALDETGLAGDWKSESSFRLLVSGGFREVDKEPNSGIQVLVLIERINNTLERIFCRFFFIHLIHLTDSKSTLAPQGKWPYSRPDVIYGNAEKMRVVSKTAPPDG
ncbi:hypothetical protein J3F84DRAFT_16519 [Trichoderma pleuroticola]